MKTTLLIGACICAVAPYGAQDAASSARTFGGNALLFTIAPTHPLSTKLGMRDDGLSETQFFVPAHRLGPHHWMFDALELVQ